ncbi:serine hydrolase [Mucilaginibacter daejeonensis]|uniref:glycoside hydrolase family 3 N-terminal domain-containing protein n=1 Tax=Mucilaginibacter daejeonensis TaxID=398049 RepID=UPI001D17B5F7|nr:glycoside hydrolase family 3 N-terminal domain-containing protein [Mucilaginibacter daejeonensis]UEG51635.1 serine hydrolase [Mucilaginibacter daejeonensis]
MTKVTRAALLSILLPLSLQSFAQQPRPDTIAAQKWVDQQFKKLSRRQKIAQLMVMRLSEKRGKDVVFFTEDIEKLIKKYKIGSVCLFQGNAVDQAKVLNKLQASSQIPLLVCIDGETGVGMRFGDVKPFPDQLTIGATGDGAIAYHVGRAIALQCKRAGIQVNYAPVVDINNNPDNPVINFRSFGEDKYKVALYGSRIMAGMQDNGVMACAKHFPGHGDVAVDSHLDLPVIQKSLVQLDSLELYPFKTLIDQHVGSMMVAHLYIPAIDTTRNKATSLSKNNVTTLLRDQLRFNGLTFTDALEMKGVAKFYPQGEAAVQSLIAGNDMLCLPGDVKGSIKKVRKAIRHDQLTWDDIDAKVKKVLMAKYNLGLDVFTAIDTVNIAADLNKDIVPIKKEVYANAITIVAQGDSTLPVLDNTKKIAYVGIGIDAPNHFADNLKRSYNADTYYLSYKDDAAKAADILSKIGDNYSTVVVGLHKYTKYPARNFGISEPAVDLMRSLQQKNNVVSLAFGNPYAIKNLQDARNLIACYEDDSLMHDVASELLAGRLVAKGKLPVTVGKFAYGTGVTNSSYLPLVNASTIGLDNEALTRIDSIANNAIAKGATPGCVVLVARKGKIGMLKGYGHMNYDGLQAMTPQTVFDLASVTKISATNISVMKLYEEGKLDLNRTLGDYLPWVRGTDKAALKLNDVLLHQAGLVAFIPFYRETIDIKTGKPKPGFYRTQPDALYSVRVADHMYMRSNWIDTLKQRILTSKLGAPNKYVYSDNDFIFLGKVVEQITGLTLDEYVRQTFYLPLGMTTTAFKPREHVALNTIAPTENEKMFRLQHLLGDVHDPGAAMFGGVAGHAGLFSNAYDLAKLYIMLLNGGELNGVRLFKKETIDYFTAYHSNISRRGLGFDKPEKDNVTSKSPYPALSASPLAYGHTGYTGIGVWADPKYDLLYIFMSNRVNPDGGENTKLLNMNVRGNIQEAVYRSILKEQAKVAPKPVIAAKPMIKSKTVKKRRSVK